MTTRGFHVLSIALVLPALLSCGGSRPASHSGPDDTAVVGVLADIENWNPYLTETAFSHDLLSLLYPTLAIEQTDYREHPPTFEPWLAESWTWSEDGLELVFTLRRGATWSDGVPVSSADVVFTWKTQLAPEIGWTGVFIKDFIEAVEAIDDNRVRFRFSRRYPYQLMDANDGLILPAHVFGRFEYSKWQEVDWQAQAISAGPFKLTSARAQQEIVLGRNDSFWLPDMPKLERVVWRIIPSQTGLLTQLLADQVDLINTVPARDIDRVRSNPSTDVVVFHDRRYAFIAWNTRKPLFADPRVRRALTLAIDRRSLLASINQGLGRISVGPILTGMWAFNRELEPLPYDSKAARELLAEAGWTDSDNDGTLDREGRAFAFELLTNLESQDRQDLCVLVHDQLRRIGIDASPRFAEWITTVSTRDSGDYDAFVGAWREPTQIDLEDIWHSSPVDEPTSNFTGYANPEVDRLISEVNQQPDFGDQKAALDRIQELIVADQPYTFLYESDRAAGISTRLGGAEINDATPYFNIHEWTIRKR